MDPSPEEVVALAEQLTQLAKGLTTSPDPASKKLQTSKLVMQAKKMIWQIQDPFDALMDQVVNVSNRQLPSMPLLGAEYSIAQANTPQTYTVATALSLSELGVFNAIPLGASATVREIAEKCDADEDLIGSWPASLKRC